MHDTFHNIVGVLKKYCNIKWQRLIDKLTISSKKISVQMLLAKKLKEILGYVFVSCF